MDEVFEAKLAGHPVRYSFRYRKTKQYFRRWLQPCKGSADILPAPKEIAKIRALIPEETSEEYLEYKALSSLTGRFLLRFDCCTFHAVAFLYQGLAWLLAAPSGTGKTTQFMNWRELFPAEITMISGDIPVLELRDGTVWVHPSPWNGKEDIGSFRTARLGGLVLLEQGKTNIITKLCPRDALDGVIKQFTVEPETETEILSMFRILDAVLSRPVWKLINTGDLASTELLRETLSGGPYEAL